MGENLLDILTDTDFQDESPLCTYGQDAFGSSAGQQILV